LRWRGRAWDPQGWISCPFYFRFVAWKRTTKGNTKEAKAVPPLPRLGFPLWNPSSEAPPRQGMTKGGNPSPLRRVRQIFSRLRGPWGSGANPSWFALRGTAFALIYFYPGRRQERPRPAPCGRCPVGHQPGSKSLGGGFGFQGPESRGPESQKPF
jgi:hypothetical protein